MNGILSTIGLIVTVLATVYTVGKIGEYLYCKKATQKDDDKIYKAARAFAQGENFDEIRKVLESSIEFDEEDIEDILSLSFPHKIDEDEGDGAFIKAVNKVLGEDAYKVRSTTNT